MSTRNVFDYFRKFIYLARDSSIIRRGIMYAVIVGPILTIINHGDEIAAGTLTKSCIIKIILTFIVPYLVSTFSSVSALIKEYEGENAKISDDI